METHHKKIILIAKKVALRATNPFPEIISFSSSLRASSVFPKNFLGDLKKPGMSPKNVEKRQSVCVGIPFMTNLEKKVWSLERGYLECHSLMY